LVHRLNCEMEHVADPWLNSGRCFILLIVMSLAGEIIGEHYFILTAFILGNCMQITVVKISFDN